MKENLPAKKMVEKLLRSAQDEIRSGITKDYVGLAITFVSPKIAPSTADKIGIDAVVNNLIKQLHTIQNTTLAWTFPASKRYLQLESSKYSGKYNGYYYPGVVIALLPVHG